MRSLLRRRARARGERPICIVHGNCQAEAVRALLDASPAFRARFDTVPVPAVHTVADGNLEALLDAIASASLIISHPVRDGYHGFPVGSEEVLEHAPRDSHRITIPALYYDGLHPFQVYVREAVDAAATAKAPVTIYHDLRFLHCASEGWDPETAGAWLAAYEPPPEALRAIAAHGHRQLVEREAEADVRVAGRLTSPPLHGRSFHTVDHPTVAALGQICEGVHRVLGIPHEAPTDLEDSLAQLQAPLEACVIDALALDVEPRPQWRVRGERHSQADLLATHLRWYAERPPVVEAGVLSLGERMRSLGLL